MSQRDPHTGRFVKAQPAPEPVEQRPDLGARALVAAAILGAVVVIVVAVVAVAVAR